MRLLIALALVVALGASRSSAEATSCGELAGVWRGWMRHAREGTLPVVIAARPDCSYRLRWGVTSTAGDFMIAGARTQFRDLGGVAGSVEVRGVGARRSMHLVQSQGEFRADLQRAR